MTRRSFLQWGLGLGLLSSFRELAVAEAGDPLQWASRTLDALGTTLHLRAAHEDMARASAALDAAVADIRHLEGLMSLFRHDSQIQQLNRDGVLRQPHADLLEVLRIAQQVSRRSQGAFDITVQPLWRVFDKARAAGELPPTAEVMAARAHVGWRRVELRGDVVALAPGMGVTLNGIAQGFIADRVRARLLQFGIHHALVDTGEFASLGQPQAGREWTLGLANPRNSDALLGRLSMQGLCMATSADDQCTFSSDRRHHHIFDPRTGYSPPDIASVTVLASRCVMADAITKVIFMAGFHQALAVAQKWGVQAVVVSKQSELRISPGLTLLQG